VSEADTARVDVDVGVDADADADADACGRSIVGAAATGGRCWSRARRESAADTVRDGPSPVGKGGVQEGVSVCTWSLKSLCRWAMNG
jgi:hypothetical protein